MMRRDLPLDGLRAVAVMLVVLSHAIEWHGLAWMGRLGGLGVGIFFVISGYIITRVFAHDVNSGSPRPVLGFYIKRAFRILPVLLAYLLVINLLAVAGQAEADLTGSVCSLLFVRNFSFCPGLPITTHFWSLSVEEQFYLWWPAVFIVATRMGWLRQGLLLFLACSITLCVISGYTGHWLVPGVTRNFPFIAMGVLLALHESQAKAWVGRHPLVMQAAPLALIAVVAGIEVPYIEDFGLYEALCFLLAPLLFALVVLMRDYGIMPRLLALPPVVFIGRISFSLYVWQQLFLESHGAIFPLVDLSPSLLLALAFAAAILSYYLIEQRSLQWRQLCLARLGLAGKKAMA